MSLIQILQITPVRWALLVQADPDERDRLGSDKTSAAPVEDDESAYARWVNAWHAFAATLGADACLVSTEPITVHHTAGPSPLILAAPETFDHEQFAKQFANSATVTSEPPGLPAPIWAKDERPHSRACGIKIHEHGAACAPDCPTCAGS